ncbi:MAG: prepilin-type N-terminal cleavage/methylation domain-containing protein [Deltaproteobacteria bacterium]|nr:prepilin-type N-terminal cleavage/methylation domain-containing protein [Deltaproteobacteria bacterium]
MKSGDGFTLPELMVVIAMVGILTLTASPVYKTYLQRAYGSQAAIMAKQIMDAQILHYLEHDKFFPTDSSKPIFIPPDSPPSAETEQALKEVEEHLHIAIPLGHRLSYQIYSGGVNADESCFIRVSAPFAIYKNGKKDLNYMISKNGKVIIF